MALELFSATKPSKSGRSLAFAIGLIAMSSMLAAGMVRSRSAQILLPKIQVPDLQLSLRPPRGFREGNLILTKRGPGLPFFRRLEDGTEVTLLIRRVERTATDEVSDVCMHLLDDLRAELPFWTLPFVRGRIPATTTTLGGRPALEVFDEKSRTRIRVALAGPKDAVAASMMVDGERPDEALIRQFDRMCEAVEFSFAGP